MPSSELFTTELNILPKHPTWSNFINAFKNVPLLKFIMNSFIMAGCITIGQIISCSLAAFSFSFLEFKGKGILFMLVMATMMVPGEATIISNYLTVGKWEFLILIRTDPSVSDICNGNLSVPAVLYDVSGFSL